VDVKRLKMPRKKAPGPSRLTDEEQRNQAWRMGEENNGAAEGGDGGPGGSTVRINPEVEFDPSDHIIISDNETSDQETGRTEDLQETISIDSDDSDEDWDANQPLPDADFSIRLPGQPNRHQQSDDYVNHLFSSRAKKAKKRKVGGKPGLKKNAKKLKKGAKAVRELDEELQSLIDDCQFYVPVAKDLASSNQTTWFSSIGKLELKLDNSRQMCNLPDRPEFWVYVSVIPGRSMLYYEWLTEREGESEQDFKKRQKISDPDEVKYFPLADTPDKEKLEAFSKQKCLFLQFHKFYKLTGTLELKICLTQESLLTFKHPSTFVTTYTSKVRRVLEQCFDIQVQHLDPEKKVLRHDIDQLYDSVKKYHDDTKDEREQSIRVNPQHISLLPKLRPYQTQAVKWMLGQERYLSNLDQNLEAEDSDQIHPLYEEVTTHDGTTLYYNRTAGYLLKKKPLYKPSPPGGILADEMGLGKTIEVLSCMLCNPRPGIEKPPYMQPVKKTVSKNKKRSRRRRTPSPVEFRLKSHEEDNGITESSKIENSDDSNDEDLPLSELKNRRRLMSSPDIIMQVDGGDTDDSESEEDVEEDDDDDYIQPSTSAAASHRRKNGTVKKSKRLSSEKLPVFSDKRTVYYHDDFNEPSSDEEHEYIPKKTKRTAKKKTPGKKSSLKKVTKGKAKILNSVLSKNKNKDNENIVEGEKLKSHYPTYSPFTQDKVIDKNTKSIKDQIIKAIHELTQFKTEDEATKGVSVIEVRKYMSSVFERDMEHASTKMKFAQCINNGIEIGQLFKTSGNATGLSGSININLHFNPNDSRHLYHGKPLSDIDQVIEEVISNSCYEGKEYEKPFTPKTKVTEKPKVEKTSKKGQVYEGLKNLYERSLPGSLAWYASQKRSGEYYRNYFDTKVKQRAYFECICGSGEEDRNTPGQRVQCTECQTEQHADCVKYDLTDPYRGKYVCPHCWVKPNREPLKSAATLIVSPSTISYQWIEEIQKHVRHKDIKMLFYRGSKHMGYMQPRTLANYDIVVTTYETLQTEFSYLDLPHSNSEEGRRFRNPKRFMAVPSPIVSIEWWRICLDEAQMIESGTTNAAKMALRLAAVNRWCVTGTPIGKSINDLYGLMLFLKIDPYLVEAWWQNCLFEPYCHGVTQPLTDLLCKYMWRTVKKNVLSQLGIPDQTDETHWLQFSPVEEYFYRKQHIDSAKEAVTRLEKFDPNIKISSLDRGTMSQLLYPLLRLRQSCCHPQAVRGQFVNLQKSTMTMGQLLEQLIKRAINEAEELHRLYVAALNGLAGLDVIGEKWSEAVDKYREVLRSAEEHKGTLKTDTLQKLHTVTNLAELLEAKHEGIDPTMRDSELRTEAQALKDRYMTKYLAGVNGSQDAVTPVSKQVDECYSGFQCKEDWYTMVIDWVTKKDQEDDLLKLVHEEMAAFYDVVTAREFSEIRSKYPNSRHVLYKINEKADEIDTYRNKVMKDIKLLLETPPEQFVNKAVGCHLRVSTIAQKKKTTCKLCEVHDNIEIYEKALFHFVKGEIKGAKGPNRATVTEEERQTLEDKGVFLYEEQRRGTWSDSEAERLLRAVLKYARTRTIFDREILDDGAIQMKLYEGLKKEFRLARILWRQLYDQVAGMDELNMSTLRLRLRYDDEPLTNLADLRKNKEKGLATRMEEKVETIYILEQHEIEAQRLKLVADKAVNHGEMKKKLGKLLYLSNQQKGVHEECPICRDEIGGQWSVLNGCSHSYCVECIKHLIEKYSVGKFVRCSVCRHMNPHRDISYVCRKNEQVEEDEDMEIADVKGDHSTKIEAVVKMLLRIQVESPGAKSLVFSTWTDVLDILATALDDNSINYAALHTQGKGKLQRNLQKFKNRDDVHVLLLPVSSGANGLNLTEASHVLLMEPILNPAQELQAIGRVHRIGQKNKTTVHRFYVKQTIEEKMQQMLKGYHGKEEDLGSHSTEENLLKIEDLRNLFADESPSNAGNVESLEIRDDSSEDEVEQAESRDEQNNEHDESRDGQDEQNNEQDESIEEQTEAIDDDADSIVDDAESIT